MKWSIREQEGNEKFPFPKFENGKGMKKIHSQNSGTGREGKKSIPKDREWESEASILENDREREFLLTPASSSSNQSIKICVKAKKQVDKLHPH